MILNRGVSFHVVKLWECLCLDADLYRDARTYTQTEAYARHYTHACIDTLARSLWFYVCTHAFQPHTCRLSAAHPSLPPLLHSRTYTAANTHRGRSVYL